jgi:LPXTG-site transpeptidase (sortase) family protein
LGPGTWGPRPYLGPAATAPSPDTATPTSRPWQTWTRGDGLWVEIPGRTLGYRVTETRVADQAEVGVLADPGNEGLTLITCYPFDALIPDGLLRFVVFAESR